MIHRRSARLLAITIAITTTAACSKDGGLTSSEAIAQFVDVFCDKAFECMDEAGEAFPFEDRADCEAQVSEDLDTDEIDASIEAGRIDYDEDAAQECLDAIRAALDDTTCEELFSGDFEDPAACDEIYQGTVENGDACTLDDDCATDGASCNGDVCTVS